MKRFCNTVRDTVTALTALVLFATVAGAEGDRPPVPLRGSWFYFHSGSHSDSYNESSWSEKLSVVEGKGKEGQKARFADIQVEETVNGVTQKTSQKQVPFSDVNTVLETLITEAKIRVLIASALPL